jgi:hypothetical protein
MQMKFNIYFLLGIFFLILSWLFIGLFRDDEFNEPGLFFKYRPTFQVIFYSPRGMDDTRLSDMPGDLKTEQIAFEEFVIHQHVQENSSSMFRFLPFLLIQLTLTFLSFGVLKMRRELVYRKWQLPVHFIVCLLLTFIDLTFILFFDRILLTISGCLLMLMINYWMLLLLTLKKKMIPKGS